MKKNSFVVLVATDYSDPADEALDAALGMAASRGGELHVLHVVEPQYPGGMPEMLAVAAPALPLPDTRDQLALLRSYIRAKIAAREGDVAKIADSRVMVHIRVGTAAECIVTLGADVEADYIVVGTHGRKGLKHLVFGSVAEKVVRTARCTVLVARKKNHFPNVPEIEPLCADCAKKRAETDNAELWCARHAEHHVFGHAWGYVDSGSTGDSGAYTTTPTL